MAKYLELFMKKKIVTAQAITSLEFVFTLFGLNEESTASLLCDTAQNMRKQPASRSKLLFFGDRILTTPSGHSGLQPIRDMLASNYRSGGSEIVQVSQKEIANSAYKASVVAGGEKRAKDDGLTPGYDVLGLAESEARAIFDEVVGENFRSDALKYYEYQSITPEYDDDGNLVVDDPFSGKPKKKKDKYADLSESMKMARGLIDKNGNKLYDNDDDDDDDEGGEGGAVATGLVSGANIFECGECGYTLFPAKGREFKFFPDEYICPECGAPKSSFKNRAEE